MFKYRKAALLFFTYFIGLQLTAQVTADFEADTTSGCGSATVQFTDLSSGNISSWNWSFGNGNTSTLQNPSANYTIIGNYNVTLTVSDGTNSDSKTITNYINIYRSPTADFSVSPTTGCSPLPVSFTDNSTLGSAPIDEYIWDFSDGSQPSSAQNPTHTYQNGGTFPPSLQIIDTNGCSDIEVFNSVVVTAAPVANFSTQKSTTCSDTLTVKFNNSSTGGSLTYLWNFGDGQTSTQADPTHFYNGLGTYDVTLIVSDPNCSDTLVLEDYVRLESTTANFSTSKNFYCYGDSIKFDNLSSGANLFRWDFGDGTSSNQENPTKVYLDSGFFEVRLTVSAGPICLKTYLDTIYVQQVVADFTVSPEFSCNPSEDVVFKNNSINGDIATWRIENSDMEGSTIYNTTLPIDTLSVTQFYKFGNRPNYYSDTLIATSQLGCSDTLIKDTSRTVELLSTNILHDGSILIPVVDTPLTLGPDSSLVQTGIVGGCVPLAINFNDTTLGPGTITSYEWDFGFSTSNLKSPPTINFIDDTLRNITLKVTNNLGCTATDDLIVGAGFKQNPNYFFEPDSACPGEFNTITDISTDSSKINAWEFRFIGLYNNASFSSFNGYYIDTNGAITIGEDFENFPDTGSYQIVHTVSQNGCDSINRDTLIYYVNGPISKPDAEISGQCADRRIVQFTGNFSGVTRFVWDFGDSTALDSVNEDPLHTYPDFKTYYPILKIYNDSNRCGPIFDTARLDLEPPPFLRILPQRRNLCTSDSINLLSNASNRYEEFNWIIDGDTISKKKNIPFDTVPGIYIIELYTIDALGCTFSALDTFFVSQLEADFDTTLLDNCFPIEVAFNDMSITDTTITKWEWRFGNGDTSFQQNDTVTYSSTGAKSVFLKIENEFGCKDSIVKNDLINFELLNLRFLNDLSQVCIGDSVTFRNVSDGLNPIYSWDFGDGTILEDTNTEFISHRYSQAGTYTVTLTAIDETGCVRSEVKTNLIQVDDVPIPGFTADTLEADCYPFAVNFQDTSKGNVSKWEWQFGDNASSNFQNPFHNYTAVGEFNVSLKVSTPTGCSDSIKKLAYIKTKGPEADFVFDKDTICINEEVRFNITQSNNVASFFWDFGDGNGGQGNPVTHTYTQKTGKIVVALILSDSSGKCTVPLEDSLFVYNVKADFTVSDDTACVPFEADFTNTSVGDDSFRWVFGPGDFSTEPNPRYNYPQAGKYQISLEISSAIGCKDTATKTVEIFPLPLAIVSADTGLCVGDSVVLIGGGGSNFKWFPTTGLSAPFSIQTLAYPDSTTTYKLIVSNEAACSDTTSVEVFVQQKLNYDSISDSSIIIGEYINFDAFAGLGFKYKWTPQEGLSCNDCPRPVAKPLRNQTYILEIIDDFGCFYLKDTINIEVIEKYSLDVPTAFSPNGDGSNDIIYAKGWGLKELIAFKIYNRFGELVFESTDFEKGWDGTYRGQPQNIETYVFTVEALTYSGKVLTKKGNISLLR